MQYSKNKIDKAGSIISRHIYKPSEEQDESYIEKYIEAEDMFDDYRKHHLEPLSETTLEIQNWLSTYTVTYFIAQRLKRKPQIIRKLNRLSVRLTQLQDIGGLRIVVQHNSDIDRLTKYLSDRIRELNHFKIVKVTDYREKGRDGTGYRAVHLIIERSGLFLELQMRSRVQHYWSESIERASVIYGHYLKEGSGDSIVISYFRLLSNIFYEIESGRQVNAREKLVLEQLRLQSEAIIRESSLGRSLDSFVNEGIIKTLVAKEKNLGKGVNNWIFVFDWNTGSFVSWDTISKNPTDAINSYVRYEKQFPSEQGYEVVLVGSSEVSSVRQTHSHYFGIDNQEIILENIDSSIIGFSRKIDLDIGARQILWAMTRKRYWGGKDVSIDTLRNHYCQNVITFDDSLSSLLSKGIITRQPGQGVSLNINMKSEIEACL